MSKKIRKTVARFDLGHQFAKKYGLPDPAGDAIYGSDRALTPQEQAAKDAEEAGSVVTEISSPTAISDETLAARESQRRRQLAAAGLYGNILTGSQGLGSSNTSQLKSLLGS